jgi:hypothetical protein
MKAVMNSKMILSVMFNLVGAFLLCALSGSVHAQSGSGADFDYIVDSGDTNNITLTTYTGTNPVVSIPTTINNLLVTGIGRTGSLGLDYPPVFGDNVANVTISSNVTSIGDFVFSGCAALTNVTIPDSVTTIDDSAFFGCAVLTNVTIPPSVTNIGDSAFFGCVSLTSLTIPESVTVVEEGAFFDCAALTNLTIQNGVVSIAVGAFYGCDGLTNVIIPGSITSIDGAFEGCNGLTQIIVDPINPTFTSVGGVLFNKAQTTLIEYPCGIRGNYTIPENVTSIEDDAFAWDTNLTSVIIPSSVTNIGFYGFSGAELTAIYFMGTAPSIENNTFSFADIGTVYYLPTAMGWPTTFGGAPTAFWEPLIQASGASFGVQTNGFGFNISWATNLTVVVEACTNLVNAAWTPVANVPLTNGIFYFVDPQWTNYSARFYRLSSR